MCVVGGLASIIGVFKTAQLFLPAERQFVDIGVYKHTNKKDVTQALLPFWRHLIDGQPMPYKYFLGGFSLAEKDLRLRNDFKTGVSPSTRVSNEPRNYETWQRGLDRLAGELTQQDALPSVLAGQGPSSAWTYFGRSLSHTARPVIVNRPRGGTLQVFDLQRADAWWFRALHWLTGPSAKRGLLGVSMKKHVPHGSVELLSKKKPNVASKTGIVMFVTCDSRHRLSDEQKTLIDATLAERGIALCGIVDVRPATGALLSVEQSNVSALHEEVESLLRDQRVKFGKNGHLDAIALITTAPAPLNFIVGVSLREQMDGQLLTFERKPGSSETELAFDSTRSLLQ